MTQTILTNPSAHYDPTKNFYHGSLKRLPIGTLLAGRGEQYDADYPHTGFYNILEKYRPPNMLTHKDSVFMCDNDTDIDNAGGGTEWLFTLEPLGPVERHDINWGSEISILLDSNDPDTAAIKRAAENYWAGIPHQNEQVWEYLTPQARILTVEKY